MDVPLFPCNAIFEAGSGIYAAMDANIYCSESVEFYLGYLANTPSGSFFGGGGCSAGDLGTCGDMVDVNVPCEAAADSRWFSRGSGLYFRGVLVGVPLL